MMTVAIIGSVYFTLGLFTVWYVSNMPRELELRECALISLAWPLFWFRQFRR
jgi:hypothetical protein